MATVAALRRYDQLLVNPIRDGLNLVAMEGPAVNERDGVLVLSREAGAYEELGGRRNRRQSLRRDRDGGCYGGRPVDERRRTPGSLC